MFVAFATLRLLDLFLGDLGSFPFNRATGRFGAGRLTVRSRVARRKRQIGSLINLLFGLLRVRHRTLQSKLQLINPA